MTILANGFRDTLGAFQTYGATASNNAYPSALNGNYSRTAAMRNITAGEGITDDKVSLPSGNRHPNCWMMPQKAGALAARNTLVGEGDISDADTWAVKLASAAITGSGDLTAFGGLIVQLIAAITGSGTVTNGDIKAFLAAVAALTGSGTISSAVRTGLGALLASVTGDGTATGSTATGIGELDADIVAYGSLTPEGIRDAVWAQIVEAGFTAEQILRLLAAHAAGAATGLEGADMRYTGLDGTTTRIDGNYSGGTRTIDSLDAE